MFVNTINIKRHFGIDMRTKIQFTMHNMLSRPAPTYGSETLALRSQDKERIETFQMRFLRAML
jgi:hypothetical protein